MKTDKGLDTKVIMAMRRTIDAIGYDLQDLYEDGIIPKEDAREMVIDADRVFTFGNMDTETENYYKALPHKHVMVLIKKAIPLDLC